MAVNHRAPRDLVSCDCCSFSDRHWRHVELRQDGATRLDVKLCRRCATAVEGAVLAIMRERNTDPVPR